MLVPPEITQLVVHRLVGTVDAPEVIIVPKLPALPVPSVGEIAVGGLASALRRPGGKNGTRQKNRATASEKMQGVL